QRGDGGASQGGPGTDQLDDQCRSAAGRPLRLLHPGSRAEEDAQVKSDAIGMPDVITRYIDAEARRDADTIVSLFTQDGEVSRGGRKERGSEGIQRWHEADLWRYEYTTEILKVERTEEEELKGREYVVDFRLTGNISGGAAEGSWWFLLEGDLISRLYVEWV